jgi:flagellar hook-basal body complex protein FliE
MSSIGGIGGGAAGLHDIMQLRQQIIDRSQLLQQVRTPTAAATESTSASGTAGGGFGQTIHNALGQVNASQNRADALTSAYETGQTQDVAKVMLARQEASVGFEATLQVRNKLLSAYQEIMKFGV